MEADKSKCLICEVSCSQRGLAFFKFPKEESRLKMWIKEISPLLDILKVTSDSLKENGRICARHFREKDFINCKQNSLVHNACPSLSVSNLNLNSQKEGELNNQNFVQEECLDEDEQSNDSNDIFQCGRCKTQFQHLSEFMDHKRFHCQKTIKRTPKSEKTDHEKENTSLTLANHLLNGLQEKLLETLPIETEIKNEEVVKIVSDENSVENKIVSFVVSDNGLLVGNQLDLTTVPTQLILTPQLPLCYNRVVIENSGDFSPPAGQVILTPQISLERSSALPNNIENDTQVSNLIITTEGTNDSNRGIVYTYPIQNSSINNSIVITSEVPSGESDGQVVLTAKISADQPDNEPETETEATYCQLSNAIDAAQESTTLEFSQRQDKEVAEDSNQADENGFKRTRTKLACLHCGKTFEKPFNLQQHERVHTGERPFQCIICGRAFAQKSNVRKHMMRHRVWPQAKNTLKITSDKSKENSEDLADQMNYSCQYCSLSFKSYLEHKKHLVVHSEFKVYRCIQKGCNETFSDLDEFLSHSKMHSSTEFRCHICLKTFTNLEELGAHQYDHDTTDRDKSKTKLKLKCKVCHARFTTAESLKNHLAVDTHKYECIHCKSVFNKERFLRRHLFIHMDSSQSKYSCQNCKKAFRTEQSLKKHVFIHLKEKPFTCEHCDKQFAFKYRLKRHLAVHLNQYFECPFKKHLCCDKTFYRKDKLRDHVNTHSHCRLRTCRICTKMYWTLAKLKQHMRKDHKIGKGKQVLKCVNCSQTFRKQKQLNQHHCTVGERKFRTRPNHSEAGGRGMNSEAVSNIEIIMVPFASECGNGKNLA